MTQAFTRVRGDRAVTWRTLLGLLLVPLTIAGVLLWGLWNPTERLDGVTAAVVNLDEPVTVDGQTVPLGRVLAGELIGGGSGEDSDGSANSADSADSADSAAERTNFTWVLTDADDAAAGLDDGRYATVVTIPKNFSKAATSLSKGADAAETATIDVATSDRGRLIDAALSNIVTSTATGVLNEQLGAQFVGSVFVGMQQLGAGVGQAAAGAHALADGGDQLAVGARQLAQGTAQLSDGAAQLSQGAAGLSSGLADYAAGAHAAAGGSATLAQKTDEYVAGVNAAISGLQAGAGQAVAPLQQLYGAIEADLVPLPPGQDKQTVLANLGQLIGGLQSASVDGPGNKLTELKDGGSALAGGLHASAQGSAQLATGADQLATGAAQLAQGASGLAAGVPELATGAAQLADGAQQSADGAGSLAKGLDEAASGIPDYTTAQRDRLASTAVKPVEARGGSDQLFNASGVPLFVGIALWAGALGTFLVLSPLWRRTTTAARGVFSIALRSALPAVVLGAAQGAIAGVVLPLMLGYDLAKGLGFFALALVAGIAFSLLVQGVTALFKGFGRFVAFVLLVVAFAVGIVSTAPAALTAIGDASPIGAASAGFQAIAMGTAGGGGAMALLALWGLAGLALTAFAVARARKRG